jgi:hypothetical protein
MEGERERAIRPEIPQPSSTTVEVGDRRVWDQRGLDLFVIHSAKRGVIFQRTGFFGVGVS